MGLLQREVADNLGVDKTTIYNWEANRTSPQLSFMPRIIAFLGYSPYRTQPGTPGKRLVSVRRTMSLSQKDLARRLGINPSTPGWCERNLVWL